MVGPGRCAGDLVGLEEDPGVPRLRASALPVPIIASNSMRSSDVRVTRYLWAIETSLPVAKTTKFPAGSVNQPDKARVTDH